MRPVLVTVEWENSEHPCGYPKVTGMRPMTWWEHLKHTTRRKLSKRDDVPDNVYVKKSDFNVAIEISKDQYAQLLLGDTSSMKALQYLKGASDATLQLIPPSEANTIVEREGDNQI